MKKATKKPSSKPASSDSLLYSFKNGVLATCEVPQLRWELHKATFRNHRCGMYQGKAYLLEQDTFCFYDVGNSLREAGTLKVYNLRTKTIDAKIVTGRVNIAKVPLIVKASELIDIGKYPRVISIPSGERKPILQLMGATEFNDFSACLLLNKTIFMAVGEDHLLDGNSQELSEEDLMDKYEMQGGRHMDETVGC